MRVSTLQHEAVCMLIFPNIATLYIDSTVALIYTCMCRAYKRERGLETFMWKQSLYNSYVQVISTYKAIPLRIFHHIRALFFVLVSLRLPLEQRRSYEDKRSVIYIRSNASENRTLMT
jgi:hypothetical protein